jgi:hypothetical protein
MLARRPQAFLSEHFTDRDGSILDHGMAPLRHFVFPMPNRDSWRGAIFPNTLVNMITLSVNRRNVMF